MSRRTLFILLFVSLALNLFILGAGAGALLFRERLHHEPEMHGGPPMFAAAEALPGGEAEAYREALSAEAMAVRPKLRMARELRRQAWARLGTDPLDPAGIVAELDKARGLQAQAQAEVDKAILDYAAHLSVADRARFGQALGQPPPHRRPRSAGPPPSEGP